MFLFLSLNKRERDNRKTLFILLSKYYREGGREGGREMERDYSASVIDL